MFIFAVFLQARLVVSCWCVTTAQFCQLDAAVSALFALILCCAYCQFHATGTLGGILLVRYYSAVLPEEPWTTGQMGVAYVTVITAAILLPGTLALWGALAVQRCQASGFSGCPLKTLWGRVLGRGSSSSSSGGGEDAENVNKELTQHLLGAAAAATVEEGGVQADSAAAAAAAAAVGPSAVAAAALAAKGFAQLQAAEASAAAAAGSAAPKVQWQLHLPAGDGVVHTRGAQAHGEVHTSVFPVEVGRPPLEQLVRSWIASVQQLPGGLANSSSSSSSSSKGQQQQQQFDVFGMGPTLLVASVQLLCDDINKAGGVSVNFVQKTHEL
jgi:hypothetical protein